MGFIVFIIIMSLLIIGQVKNIVVLKNNDDVSKDIGDEYFDDFETL